MAFQALSRFGGNSHSHSPGLLERKKQQQRRDVFSTKFYCQLAMTWITEKELERKMKNKDEFRWKRNMRILKRDEKMSGSEKKKQTETQATFLP